MNNLKPAMALKKLIPILAGMMVLLSLNGCSHVKNFFGFNDGQADESHSVTQPANQNVLVINQKTYDLSNRADSERALTDITQIEYEIKRNLSKNEQKEGRMIEDSPVENQEPVFKNSERIEVESIPLQKDDGSIFIQ